MVLRYWEPTARLDRTDTEFDRLVTRFFGTAPRAGATAPPAADVVTDGNDVVISVELPGLSPEEIDVEVAPRRLTVTGERTATPVAEGERVLARGRRHGRFQSTFRLPAGVGAENVKAAYEHGVLTVRIHEVSKPVPEPVKVPVTSGPATGATAIETESTGE